MSSNLAETVFMDDDYHHLDKNLEHQKTIRLADVKDKIIRVAFDVVRFKDDDDLDNLWVVQEKDGEEVIVAMYDDDKVDEQVKSASSSWSALPDRSGKHVNVFYKDEPITRFATSSVRVSDTEIDSLCRALSKKLSSDNKFKNKFLSDLSNSDREALLMRFPELKG